MSKASKYPDYFFLEKIKNPLYIVGYSAYSRKVSLFVTQGLFLVSIKQKMWTLLKVMEP